MHFGFDTGSGHWPSGYNRPITAAMLHIRDWWPLRHEDPPLYRELIREQISILRQSALSPEVGNDK